jgi:hypothetical protein
LLRVNNLATLAAVVQALQERLAALGVTGRAAATVPVVRAALVVAAAVVRSMASAERAAARELLAVLEAVTAQAVAVAVKTRLVVLAPLAFA